MPLHSSPHSPDEYGALTAIATLGSRDKVGGRNEIREAIRGERLANQGIHSAAADYNSPFMRVCNE